ncbi:MAG: MiaB/RimO family radical SAM methylthiotransferase [Terriglobales bacterium]
MGGDTFRVENFGCRANQADGAAIARGLAAAGWREAARGELVIFNTCTVTAAADAEARQAIRRLQREQPGARIWVTGCYAERDPEALAGLGAERVLGNGAKGHLAELAGSPAPRAQSGITAPRSGREGPPDAAGALTSGSRPLAPTRTRPLIKVQDGCGNACSFCVIPAVRGGLRSRPAAAVAAEIAALTVAGAQEVVLTGIHLGQWGRDLPGRPGLPDLLRAILAASAIARLRLSSIEPMSWTGELIAMMAADHRIAAHAHIPLQSGSDAVLRRMRRRYRPAHYVQRVGAIRRELPDAAIGADVMAAFPGETEAEFEETLAFIASLPLTYLHAFTYSPRPGTEAARRLGAPGWEAVPPGLAAARAQRLRAVGAQLRRDFARGFLGRELEVLTLAGTQGGFTPALSANYIEVGLTGAWPANRQCSARAAAWDGERLLAVSIPG